MQLNIALIGIGTIGSGVFEIITKNFELIEKRSGIKLVIKKVCDLNKKAALKAGVPEEKYTKNVDDILDDKDIHVVVELIGGYEPARTFILKAIEKKKHIVTANKALLAKHGPEIFKAAEQNKVNVMFEASVAGCIPIIRSLERSYAAENITSIYGILNGTTNYILTKMSEGMTYDKALKQAQELGFAELDPSSDVEGKDAAQKLVILSSIAFNAMMPDSIYTEGIAEIKKQDMQYAKELGYTIKLLGIAKKEKEIELRVHPTMIPTSHELANVNNELNSVYIVGDNIKDVMLQGRGAGKLPTASIIVGDIVTIGKRIETDSFVKPIAYFNRAKVSGIGETKNRYYLRFEILDKPGVLAKISKALGDNNVSISAALQKEEIKEHVPVILTTHNAKEKDVKKSIKEIQQLDVVKEKPVIIRIEDLK